jgi:hypothetical protein
MAIACAPKNEQQARVCVDQSNRVVERDRCATPRTGGVVPYFWYYHAGYARSAYPATGTLVHAGGRAVTVKAPVARGGFGSTASGRAAAS